MTEVNPPIAPAPTLKTVNAANSVTSLVSCAVSRVFISLLDFFNSIFFCFISLMRLSIFCILYLVILLLSFLSVCKDFLTSLIFFKEDNVFVNWFEEIFPALYIFIIPLPKFLGICLR